LGWHVEGKFVIEGNLTKVGLTLTAEPAPGVLTYEIQRAEWTSMATQ
jgi:hypothetical protein